MMEELPKGRYAERKGQLMSCGKFVQRYGYLPSHGNFMLLEKTHGMYLPDFKVVVETRRFRY